MRPFARLACGLEKFSLTNSFGKAVDVVPRPFMSLECDQFLICCFSFSHPYSRCGEPLTRISKSLTISQLRLSWDLQFPPFNLTVERHDEMSEKLYSAFGIGPCV